MVFVARIERSEIRGKSPSSVIPDFAALNPGYDPSSASKLAFPPAAAVLIVTTCSSAKRRR